MFFFFLFLSVLVGAFTLPVPTWSMWGKTRLRELSTVSFLDSEVSRSLPSAPHVVVSFCVCFVYNIQGF